MTVSLGNNGALFQRVYHKGRVQDLTYPVSKFWAMVPKETNFGGASKAVAIITDGPAGGRSHAFATAQSRKTGGTEKQWLITRVKDYSLISIETETIMAGNKDKGTFLRIASKKTDQALKNLVYNLGVGLYTNHGAARARVGSTSTTTLTLADPRDITKFAVGMYLDSSTTDGTSGSADGGSVQVTAINRRLGTLTAAGNWTAAGNFSNNDYIFQEGDFGLGVSGLDSWLPATDPTSTPFFNVDRSVDTDRLGGIRYDGSNEPIEEALQNAEAEVVGVAGGDPMVVFMHPTEVAKLKVSLGSKVEYDMMKSSDRADISFKTVALVGSNREMRIVGDVHCPKGVAYMLDLSTWAFASLGPAPMIGRAMGAQFQWDTNADSVEIRTMYYGNLYCTAPGFNVRIALPT